MMQQNHQQTMQRRPSQGFQIPLQEIPVENNMNMRQSAGVQGRNLRYEPTPSPQKNYPRKDQEYTIGKSTISRRNQDLSSMSPTDENNFRGNYQQPSQYRNQYQNPKKISIQEQLTFHQHQQKPPATTFSRPSQTFRNSSQRNSSPFHYNDLQGGLIHTTGGGVFEETVPDFSEDWLPNAVRCKERRHTRLVGNTKIISLKRVFTMANGSTETVEDTFMEKIR